MKPEEVSVFPVGEKNVAFGKYFVGQSYLNMLTTSGVPIGNVTFEPGCRITGIFTMQNPEAARSFSVPQAGAIIRNGEKRPGN